MVNGLSVHRHPSVCFLVLDVSLSSHLLQWHAIVLKTKCLTTNRILSSGLDVSKYSHFPPVARRSPQNCQWIKFSTYEVLSSVLDASECSHLPQWHSVVPQPHLSLHLPVIEHIAPAAVRHQHVAPRRPRRQDRRHQEVVPDRELVVHRLGHGVQGVTPPQWPDDGGTCMS